MLRRCLVRLVSLSEVESRLKASVLKPSMMKVTDMSAGCGSFFKVEIESESFRDKTILQQHRMVNDVLKNEIKELHGVTISTKVPA